MRVLFCLDEDVQGWDLAALEHDGFGRQDLKAFQRIAVVGASWQVSLQMKILAFLISGEVRNFSRAELPEAWTWIGAEKSSGAGWPRGLNESRHRKPVRPPGPRSYPKSAEFPPKNPPRLPGWPC